MQVFYFKIIRFESIIKFDYKLIVNALGIYLLKI